MIVTEPIWQNFFNKNKFKIIDFLRNVPIFDGLKELEYKRLEKYVFIRRYMLNESLFRQMEPGAGMYIIINGDVKIQLEQGDAAPKVLVTLSTGDFFGEMALLDESPRSAGAVTASNQVELISFFRSDLQKLIDEYPAIGAKILWNIGKVISARLRKGNETLNEYRSKLEE